MVLFYQAAFWDLFSHVASLSLSCPSVPELSCSHSRPDKFPNSLEPDTGKKILLRSVDGRCAT